MHMPNSFLFIAGVRSFKFLGLGYRVDWPINIVLTPGALEIYAEIFGFLIQVKLAVFSLASVWCSLKVWMPNLIKLQQKVTANFLMRSRLLARHKTLRSQVWNHKPPTISRVELPFGHRSWFLLLLFNSLSG